jgi:hypothetical protein
MAIVDLTGYTENLLSPAIRPVAHSRGYVSQMSGANFYGVGNGGAWAATFTIPAMKWVDAIAFRALVSSADGRAGTVLINPDKRISEDRKTRFTDGFAFSDVTTFSDNLMSFAGSVTTAASASRDSQVDQITIELPADIDIAELPGMIVGIGDPFGARGSYQAMEASSIVDLVGVDATVKIRPRLRRSIAVGDPVFIGSPPLRMRFASDDPASAIVKNGNFMPPATFDMVEAD